MELSFWEKNDFLPHFDFLIIGSGLVGLSAAIAYASRYPQKKVGILERGTLPTGASTKNAGFACFGSMTELIDDLRTRSETEVFGLVEKRWRGLQKLRTMLGDAAIDYREYGGFEVFRPAEKVRYDECAAALTHFNQQLATITGRKETFVPSKDPIHKAGFSQVSNCIASPTEGQINTGLMMRSLLKLARSKNVDIWNGVYVQEVTPNKQHVTISCGALTFKAEQALICTNGFATQLLPALEVEPARNQVVITAPIKNLLFKGAYHYDRGYYYFRNVGNRVLLGGGRMLNRNEERTAIFGHTPLIQNALETLLKEMILPNTPHQIEHRWSGIMGVGNHKSPIITRLHDRLGVAVRMGGMGIAVGSLVGAEAVEMMSY